jgi:SAM-dependent methyltransferase
VQPDRIFGDVADLYDRRRPGYPEAMVDAVLTVAPDPWRVVESGAGTGKATARFVERGASVLAIEPDPRMADRCRVNAPGAEVVVGRFEDIELAPGGFTIGLAAQSWHWVDQELGAARMARAIAPGGVLALVWNAPGADRSAVRLAIEAVYARHVPELVEGAFANRRYPLEDDRHSALVGPDRFAAAEWLVIPWTQRYTSLEYVELLETHSDHQSLPPVLRAALLVDIRAAIDEHGGFLDYQYETDVGLFRR